MNTDTDHEEFIKNCPFHDSEDDQYISKDPDKFRPRLEEITEDGSHNFYVQCPYCGTRGPITGQREDAIVFWNVRN